MQLHMRVVLKKTFVVAIACFLSARPALGLGRGANLRVGHFPVIGLVRPVNEDFLLQLDGQVTMALMVILVVLTVVGIVWSLKPFGELTTPRCDGATQSQGPVEAWTFVGSSGSRGEQGRADVLLPSGAWRGYSHEQHEDFEPVEFVFQFARGGEKRPGQVTSSGTDDIGQYSIAGIFEQQRIAFQKKYIWGTPALNFQVNEQNSGHVVEYRAEWAGENLRKGIKGFWYIEEPCGSPRIRGTFHIWPAMDGWQRIPMRGTTAPPPVSDQVDGPRILPVKDTPRRYPIKVEQDQICAKCYTNPINVCLLPCGHTAICKACEQNLRHRLCPICYSQVNMIITEDGTVVKTRQSSATSNYPSIIPGVVPMPTDSVTSKQSNYLLPAASAGRRYSEHTIPVHFDPI